MKAAFTNTTWNADIPDIDVILFPGAMFILEMFTF